MCVSYILKDQFLLYLFIYSCSSQNSSISLIALKKKGLHAGHKTLQLYALIMQLFFLFDSALPSEFLPRIVVYDLKGFQPNLGSIIIVSEAFVFTSLSFIQGKVLVFSCFFFLFVFFVTNPIPFSWFGRFSLLPKTFQSINELETFRVSHTE